jgi:uncharacterized protein YqeY
MMRLSLGRSTFSVAALLALARPPPTAWAFLPRPVPLSHSLRSFHATRLAAAAPIVDQVMDEMKLAMKAKDTPRLNTIRLIRAAFGNAAIESKTDKLTDEAAVAVLRKMAKMRQDSIAMFTDGGALDRAEMEKKELDVLELWLPAMADEDTTRTWVKEAIDQVGDANNIGKIMGALMKAHKAEIDGSMAQKIVKEEVAKLT